MFFEDTGDAKITALDPSNNPSPECLPQGAPLKQYGFERALNNPGFLTLPGKVNGNTKCID